MHKKSFLSLVALCTITCLPWAASAQTPAAIGQVEVSAAVHHDISPPLRDIPSQPRAAGLREKPLRLIPRALTAPRTDPVVQTSAPIFVAPTPGLNFAGVGNGDYGFTPNSAPPRRMNRNEAPQMAPSATNSTLRDFFINNAQLPA